MNINRVDLISLNGPSGEHYTWTIQGTEYRLGPHAYALYKKFDGWRESATLTNTDLLRIAAEVE